MRLLSEKNVGSDAAARRYDSMKMIDVTPMVAVYRECVRHLWNTCFFAETTSFDDIEKFRGIERDIFSAMVVDRIIRANDLDELAPSDLIVVGIAGVIPAFINRDVIPGGYWDHPTKQLSRDDHSLAFHSFFDWDDNGQRDYQFVRVIVHKSHGENALADRHALVEWNNVRIEIATNS